jgi:molecular chaperone Hsp33
MYKTATAALGRALTGTLIMGSMLKGDQSVAVKIDGGGPLGKIVCEADNSGKVMGYVENGEVYLKYNNGKLAVGLGVGTDGYLQVVKDLHLKEPFVSSVPLVSGEIAQDFTYYFAVSEQVPSSVSLGVLVGLDDKAIAAGGFIVQIMPNCKEEVISLIEENVKKIRPISELILEKKTPHDIIKMLISDNKYEVLQIKPVKFECRCSKEQFRKGIKSLGKKTILDLMKDEITETTCQYCGKKYQFTKDELNELIK